jgi:K+-transporting ATPase A subunit
VLDPVLLPIERVVLGLTGIDPNEQQDWRQYSVSLLMSNVFLRGIAYKPLGAAAILRRNLLIYGLGGVVVPFVGIKAIDIVLAAVGLA